ncbi:Arginase/agmatinase/formiminoglutamase [Beutenbergia cavernae DSM 12333]|uniref:Arginase/agmatinase/formiminoglutamase n=1 Tax=Beutenbergia cavernae (strain ATCC BAA-8 / DSM 12333 / CCUG 43141 / JCM 11478 / NBRC 16432 / NCIMB 13614 / HKI 0122) TaxID=471853 RepID=C5C4W3_BEUC1|nr:arginase family protein [Beutenbergia cavernae]ACQ80091.1 Arginase/agmatinase/formiminoglutamase [Beutenbergia cavernae DSM 12333]
MPSSAAPSGQPPAAHPPSPSLPSDPLWPRAGDWPALGADAVDLALLGIGTHRTSLSPTGAHATPAAVRAALRRYSPYVYGHDDDGPGGGLGAVRCADAGDVTEPDDHEARATAAAARAAALARVTMVLGGDNAATVPAALGAWGSGIASAGLVTLDAHHDLRDGVSNGSPVRRLIEAGLDPRRVVQVGIADFANSERYAARARELGITVIHRDELHVRPMADLMAEALEIAGAGGGVVHVDLDVDVCDRSVAPGCPASVPGGIAAHELRSAARAAGTHPAVRSVDVTEVDATADVPDGRTVRLAALCVLEVAAGLARRAA